MPNKKVIDIKEVDMTDRDCQYVGIAYFNDKGQKVTESFVIPNNGITIKTNKGSIKFCVDVKAKSKPKPKPKK